MLLIREAQKNDMPCVLELIKELALFEKEPHAVETTVDILMESGFGNNPDFKCFVAEFEAAIVGMALVFFRFSTWKGKVLHLEDLIVTKKARKKGIGKKLLDQVVLFGKENKVKRISWEVLDWNQPAKNFYKQHGATILKHWEVVHLNQQAIENYIRHINSY